MLCGVADGLVPGVHLHANDREGLEKLCGYGARLPFALERLSMLPTGESATASSVRSPTGARSCSSPRQSSSAS